MDGHDKKNPILLLKELCQEAQGLAGVQLKEDGFSSPFKTFSIPFPEEAVKKCSNKALLLQLYHQYSTSLETILNKCPLEDLKVDPQMVADAFNNQFLRTIQLLPVENNLKIKEQNPYDSSGKEDSKNDTVEEDSPSSDNQNSRTAKKFFLEPEAKDLLEKVFKVKKCPNTSERLFIAQKLGLTASQVRIWFTNKRMRTKSKQKKVKPIAGPIK